MATPVVELRGRERATDRNDRGPRRLCKNRRPERWRRRLLQRTALDVDRSPLDILAPVLMYCAILWWIGRRMSWARPLVVAAITLALTILVLLFERGWR